MYRAVHSLRTKSPDDAGYTLIELIVVMGILAVFLGLAGSTLTKMAESSKRNSDKIIAEGDLRIALDRMARDFRAAAPISPRSLAGTAYTNAQTTVYANEVGFDVFCATCVPTTRAVRYRLLNNTMERILGTKVGKLIGPPGTAGVPTNEDAYAIVNTATEPVFTYYRKDGTVIATDGTHPPEAFQHCAKAVKIDLRMKVERRSSRVINFVTRVTLRNFNEVTFCDTNP